MFLNIAWDVSLVLPILPHNTLSVSIKGVEEPFNCPIEGVTSLN